LQRLRSSTMVTRGQRQRHVACVGVGAPETAEPGEKR
jgi:hypothetical protein